MKFALLIIGSPEGSAAPLSALRFAEAALAGDHEIYRVFFYHEGVYTGSELAVPPQDEPDVRRDWQQLSRKAGFEMIVCVASALRRGMLDAAEAARNEKEHFNLHPGFEISGLGQLIDAGLEADRLITFR